MAESEIEKLKEQIKKLEQERDELKCELAQAKAAPVANWTLQQRTSLAAILGRPDQGMGMIGNTVAIAGWVKTIRFAARNTVAFLKINDGSYWEDIQVVVDKGKPGFEKLEDHSVSTASSVFIVGIIVASKGKEQLIELQSIDLRLMGTSDAATYPLAKKAHTVEFLREIGHFRPRSQLITAITRIRNALAFATHLYFQQQGYLYIHTPIITASDCEGAGEMFQITTLLGQSEDRIDKIPKTKDGKVDYSEDFFKKPAFLTVSGQLNGEIYACALGSIYTFGPTFRAEDSHTSRHLAEFWMIEPEIAFADLVENMNIAEGYIKFVLNYAMEKHPKEMEYLEQYEVQFLKERKKAHEEEEKLKAQAEKKEGEGPKKKKKVKDIRGFRLQPLRERIKHVITSNFARITYTEAVETLKKSGVEFEKPVEWGIDLASEHEKWLAEEHYKKPVIVRDYPKEIKAFYMKLNDDGKTVAAMDVLVPGVGELVGGSQREEKLDVLQARIKEAGLDENAYSWYLDLRRYGSVVHSGFGLGFERLVCYTTGVENIREVIPFPRWPGHVEY